MSLFWHEIVLAESTESAETPNVIKQIHDKHCKDCGVLGLPACSLQPGAAAQMTRWAAQGIFLHGDTAAASQAATMHPAGSSLHTSTHPHPLHHHQHGQVVNQTAKTTNTINTITPHLLPTIHP